MFLPIGDSPNPPGKPWVTYGLIVANVLVYLALLPLGYRAASPDDPELLDYLTTVAQERRLSPTQIRQLAMSVSEYDLVVYRHGFRPAAPSAVDVVTSMFLHGGLLHLLGNMLFLWIFGDNVEQRLGRFGFLAVYLATGAAAALGDGLIRLGSNVPSVGASGAISGVLGLYFLWFPRNRVRVWIFLFPFFMDVVEIRARIVLGFYVIAENVLPLILAGGATGVSHGAHIGGFVAGLGAAALIDRLSGSRSRIRTGVSAEDKLRQGRELERRHHPRAALAAYQRFLADHPRDRNRAAAHLGAARVLMGPLGNPTGAYQHLYAALEEDPPAAEETEARALIAELGRTRRSVPRKLSR
jgi:membrane associated rhomboid family serine protease